MEDIDHLTAYANSLINLDQVRHRHEAGAVDDDELEEAKEDAEDAARKLLHDVYAFVERSPSYKDYRGILGRHGIPLDARAIVAQDTGAANDELIVASMLAISRSDRFDGHGDDFGACAKDGTFARWLNKLCESRNRWL